MQAPQGKRSVNNIRHQSIYGPVPPKPVKIQFEGIEVDIMNKNDKRSVYSSLKRQKMKWKRPARVEKRLNF
ncbi:hypothetical protein QTN25_001592 [Entamoeba marina]